ncbi:MAG TPA: class D sortase [Acidimicrobiia bacterium]|nr:class D sortase [Acidimicrobiia bacterium]
MSDDTPRDDESSLRAGNGSSEALRARVDGGIESLERASAIDAYIPDAEHRDALVALDRSVGDLFEQLREVDPPAAAARSNALRAASNRLAQRLAARPPTATNGHGEISGALAPMEVVRRALGPPGEERMARAGRIMTWIGILLILFFVHQFWMSGISESRAQQLLLGQLQKDAVTGGGGGGGGAGGVTSGQPSGVLTGNEGKTGGAPAKPKAKKEPPPPAPGDPVALIQMPSIELEAVVVEGTSGAQLQKGPGHFRNTVMPGQSGNAAIAGKRTTYGAPFSKIGELEAGDQIQTTTLTGVYRYQVEGKAKTVRSNQRDPLRPTKTARLTLVTSDPSYIASNRLVVTARMLSKPAKSTAAAPTSVVDPPESGLSGDFRVWAQTLIFLQLLVGVFLAARILYRRWLRWPTYIITTPILLALLILFFESVSMLLPSTF